MGYWKGNEYMLSGDGQTPQLTQRQIDALSVDVVPSLVFNRDIDKYVFVHGDGTVVKKVIIDQSKLITDIEMLAMVSPNPGKTYWNTDKQVLVTYNNAEWVEVVTGLLWDLLITEDFEVLLPAYMHTTNDGADDWYVGTYEPYTGTQSLYTSNTDDTGNAYSNSVVQHLYFDIVLASSFTVVELSVMIKCASEAGYDGLRVFACETSVTINGGSAINGGMTDVYELTTDLISSILTFEEFTFPIPSHFIGSTVRVVFQFTSDSSVNSGNGLNIDNLKLKSR